MRVPLGKIGNGLPKCRIDHNINRGFFFNFPYCSFNFSFAGFHMSFWKRPMSAVNMFDEQNFSVSVRFAVYNCAAGFFMLHGIFLLLYFDDLL